MINIDEKYMLEALKEAEKALANDEVPIGAVIVGGGRIISRAHNQTEQLNDPTAHAEMIAITAATNALGAKYLKECTLYVTIEPCPMCASALYLAQVGRVVYGAKDIKRGYSTISDRLLHPKCSVESGLLEERCSAIVTNFFKSKRL